VDFGVLSTNLCAAGWAHNQSATPECFDASADSIRKRCSERSSREGEAEHLVLGLPGEALPARIGKRSLTSLQQRLVKTGGRLIKHARYYWLLLAESHLTRRLFGGMLQRIATLPSPAG
jgi:hypothetical protein